MFPTSSDSQKYTPPARRTLIAQPTPVNSGITRIAVITIMREPVRPSYTLQDELRQLSSASASAEIQLPGVSDESDMSPEVLAALENLREPSVSRSGLASSTVILGSRSTPVSRFDATPSPGPRSSYSFK